MQACDAQAGGVWQCGDRALCHDLHSAGVGVNCSCPVQPLEWWGFPYGGGNIISNSAGFAGCFEQWNSTLVGFKATAAADERECSFVTPFAGAV